MSGGENKYNFIVAKNGEEEIVTILRPEWDAKKIWSRVVERACEIAVETRGKVDLDHYFVSLPETQSPDTETLLAAVDSGEAHSIKGMQVEPPAPLARYVTRIGPTLITEDVLAKAQAFIDAEAEAFPQWVSQDLKSMGIFVRDMKQALKTDIAVAQAARSELYQAAYRLSGQAGTYGFPLATQVAQQLFEFLSVAQDLTNRDVQIAEVHVESLHMIFSSDLRDASSEAARVLSEHLDNAIVASGRELPT